MKYGSTLITKILTVLLVFMGISSSAHAFRLQEIPDLIKHPRAYLLAHPDFMAGQLKLLIGIRCQRFAGSYYQYCTQAADQMVEDLQLAPILLGKDNTPYVVTFTSDLEELYQNPATDDFLKALLQKMGPLEEQIKKWEFVGPEEIQKLDIGILARQYFGSEEEAVRALAVLFQDMPSSEIQVHYWLQVYGETERVRLLHKVLRKLPEMRTADGYVPLQFFGHDFYNSKLYHVLVPAYLAQRLKKWGYPNVVAFDVPFLFNYLYEATEVAGSARTYIAEPLSIAKKDDQDDIRAGELGAMFGVGLAKKYLEEEQPRGLLTEQPRKYLFLVLENIEPGVNGKLKPDFFSYSRSSSARPSPNPLP